ncbi:hypothetical protein F4703DRAFT_1787973 [Phycomyces blakesleeanus]
MVNIQSSLRRVFVYIWTMRLTRNNRVYSLRVKHVTNFLRELKDESSVVRKHKKSRLELLSSLAKETNYVTLLCDTSTIISFLTFKKKVEAIVFAWSVFVHLPPFIMSTLSAFGFIHRKPHRNTQAVKPGMMKGTTLSAIYCSSPEKPSKSIAQSNPTKSRTDLVHTTKSQSKNTINSITHYFTSSHHESMEIEEEEEEEPILKVRQSISCSTMWEAMINELDTIYSDHLLTVDPHPFLGCGQRRRHEEDNTMAIVHLHSDKRQRTQQALVEAFKHSMKLSNYRPIQMSTLECPEDRSRAMRRTLDINETDAFLSQIISELMI